MSRTRWPDADLFAFAAVGGALGASARYAMEVAIPTPSGGWPSATFVVNLSGAFILGVLIVLLTRLAPDPASGGFARRAGPFFVTGVLGGYTTFSTYMVEAHDLLNSGQALTSALYIFGSLFAGVVLVALGMQSGRWAVGRFGAEERDSKQQRTDERVATEDEG